MLLNKKSILSTIIILTLGITLFSSSPALAYKVLGEDKESGITFEEKLLIESTEVVKGEVVSTDNDWPGDTEYKYFEIDINAVEKTNSSIQLDDIIKVRYPSGVALVTGNKPVLIREGNIVKVYGKSRRYKEEPYIEVKYGGDAVMIVKGEAPSEVDYVLSLFGINSFNPSQEAINIAIIVGMVVAALIILSFLKSIFKFKR